MIGKALVFFFIAFELLFLTPFQPAVYFFFFPIQLVAALNQEKRSFMKYILAVYRIKETFAKRKVMNGIQHVGFTFAVIACKAVDMAAEL